VIRRPLWNRGGGVFVEEAGWSAHGRAASAALSAANGTDDAGGVATLLAADEPLADRGVDRGESSPARWVHVRIVTDR